MEPKRLILDAGLIVMWFLFSVPLIFGFGRYIFAYWVFDFCVIFGIIIAYDLRVIFGLAEGLGVPILTLPRPSTTVEETLNIEGDEVDVVNVVDEVDEHGTTVFNASDGIE
jgi:hypothetical protein